ncbi:MAG: BCIP domain-containing protein [archaeon]|nr:BCIP domain-containing protein [archaeon]
MEKRKHQRDKENEDDMDIEEEGLNIESNPTGEIVNVEFTFSNIQENNFHSIKGLLKPIFEFQDINLTDLFDILLSQHEDIGTTIKVEEDVYGVFSFIPITYYKIKNKFNKFINTFESYLLEKADKFYNDNKNTFSKIKEILNGNSKIGFLINERGFNLPEELLPPAMKCICTELKECQVEDGYDGKYEFDYLLIISKFVKLINQGKKGKKRNLGPNSDYDQIAYYKFETPLYIKNSDFSFEYRLPYEEKGLELLENQNEPQYINICLIKKDKFINVLKKDLGVDI